MGVEGGIYTSVKLSGGMRWDCTSPHYQTIRGTAHRGSGGCGPSRRTASSLGTGGLRPLQSPAPSLGPHRPDPTRAVDQEHTEPGRVRRPCRLSTFRSHRSVCHAISEPHKENGGPSARHRHDGGPGHGRLHGVLVMHVVGCPFAKLCMLAA